MCLLFNTPCPERFVDQLVKVSPQFPFVGWDLCPARKTFVNRTLSFVIDFFVIPMLLAFVVLLAIR